MDTEAQLLTCDEGVGTWAFVFHTKLRSRFTPRKYVQSALTFGRSAGPWRQHLSQKCLPIQGKSSSLVRDRRGVRLLCLHPYFWQECWTLAPVSFSEVPSHPREKYQLSSRSPKRCLRPYFWHECWSLAPEPFSEVPSHPRQK